MRDLSLGLIVVLLLVIAGMMFAGMDTIINILTDIRVAQVRAPLDTVEAFNVVNGVEHPSLILGEGWDDFLPNKNCLMSLKNIGNGNFIFNYDLDCAE